MSLRQAASGWRARAGRAVLLALLSTALAAGSARSVETEWWIANSPADHAGSESRGVVVNPDGSLVLGPQAESSPTDSATVAWSVAVLRDGSVAIGADHGRILRWTARGGLAPWARVGDGQVLALAADGDGVVAGTAPHGLVYRVTAGGDTSRLAATGERYVWGLAPAGARAWYAATGTRGRLLRIENGRVRVVLDSDESNLVSIISDGHGGAFAGGDSRGRVFHARADGSVRSLLDAPEDEIRALALGRDGALYAAALSASSVSTEQPDGSEEPKPATSPVSGARAVVYRIVPDSSIDVLWKSPQPFVFALAGGPDGVLAATGDRAGVYRLAATGGATQWLAPPQGQVTALAVDASGRTFAVTSNPVSLWRLGPARAREGSLISGVQDARRLARFGRATWEGRGGGGHVRLATRSGNTDPPDTTWTPWRSCGADGAIASPPGRYLQWRLSLEGGDPRVEAVSVSWRQQNVAPRLADFVVAPQGRGFREGELQPHPEPITQTLPGGRRVQYSAPSASKPRELRDLPMWARGLRTVQWHASDPNGDDLRFTLEVSREGEDAWIPVGRDLTDTSFTWDTSALPDGRYRLRVTATDAPDNAVGEALTAQLESEPFSVDNTPPEVTALSARPQGGGLRVEGHAQDATSPLARLEVSLDDDDWRLLSPERGLTDDRTLDFRATLPDVKPGEHTVSVRAVDLAGNAGLRSVHVTVPRGR